MRAFIESDHTRDSTTRHYRTGFIVYLKNLPIYWKSKNQISIETIYFGSEFILMKFTRLITLDKGFVNRSETVSQEEIYVVIYSSLEIPFLKKL